MSHFSQHHPVQLISRQQYSELYTAQQYCELWRSEDNLMNDKNNPGKWKGLSLLLLAIFAFGIIYGFNVVRLNAPKITIIVINMQ